MRTIKRASKGTTITIVKYGVYQVLENAEGQQKNSKGTAEEQQRNNAGTAKEHKQERKKERKEENITVSKDTVQQIGVSFRIELTEVYHETIPKIFNKDKGILENL